MISFLSSILTKLWLDEVCKSLNLFLFTFQTVSQLFFSLHWNILFWWWMRLVWLFVSLLNFSVDLNSIQRINDKNTCHFLSVLLYYIISLGINKVFWLWLTLVIAHELGWATTLVAPSCFSTHSFNFYFGFSSQ